MREAAKELGISSRRVRKLCQDGKLGHQYGWQWLISRDELEAFKKLPRNPGRPNKESQ